MPDDDLVRELRELAAGLRTPVPPDVRDAVRARLAGPRSTGSRPAGTRAAASRPAAAGPARRRWVAAAAAVLAAVALLLVPPVRTAAAQAATAVLRFAGIVVDPGPGAAPPPAASPAPLPSRGAVSLAEARRRAAFAVGVPDRLGLPEAVELADPDPSGTPRVVTLLYRGGALRLDQFDGTLDPIFLKTLFVAGASWFDMDGGQGLWIPAPHTVTYVGRDRVAREATARLAGATLIWQRGTVSYRLEGDLTRDEALAIARSLH